MSNNTYTLPVLTAMRTGFLKLILSDNELSTSGKKEELIQRILDYQTKINAEKEAWEHMMLKGEIKQEDEFEKVMLSYITWCKENNFQIHKVNSSGHSFSLVHINEIRFAFMEYDPSASPLRKDRLVPVPNTKMDIFLEMFFEKLGTIWYFFDADEEHDREFGEEYQGLFVEELKKMYEI